ncbi:three-helix bundle dimerization domain-containing protein [Streptomyces mirabilis]|uniref:three-helix bundle dimerization domain-containing protein n=1 Tax=Streptomyces mirabilis TaxID=68239 RepID=UPI0036CB3BDA
MANEHSLDPVIDFLTGRFSQLAPQTVAETVYATHAQLKEKATITTHMASLTQRKAAETLAQMLPAEHTHQV